MSFQDIAVDRTVWPILISSGLDSGQARIQAAAPGSEETEMNLGYTGQVLVGTLHLKALGPGTAAVSVSPQSLIADITLNEQTLVSDTGVSYQILP